ncbi:MAG: hypothetical protein LDL51_10005 [Chloroflexi bacterium]|nr:hypothetical protein [Chloroflexota bacterium]
MSLHFHGTIKNVRYQAFLTEELPRYDFAGFNINEAGTFGKIVSAYGEIAFSKWVSPKRTRSYPFERIYNTLNAAARLTVIPVLKDEGLDGDLDRIQYSTISWMNLMNVYIVLAYYDQAGKNIRPLQVGKHKITAQEFNAEIVNRQIAEIIESQRQSALHWNLALIENRFVSVYRAALDSYEKISQKTGVKMHDRERQEDYLAVIMRDFHQFRDISLRGSRGASIRETQTEHYFEYLSDGGKASFDIENYLGGTYYLTADEVIWDDQENLYIIQESKNASNGFLPSLSDIKDGLFKLILYSNLHVLELDSVPVNFRSRLKLTGKKVKGTLSLPCDENTLAQFLKANQGACSRQEAGTIRKLNLEASSNAKLEIQISSNTP